MAAIPGEAGPGAPYPQWIFNTSTHLVSEVTSATGKALAETVSWPDKLIFFTSQAAADAYGGTNNPLTPATRAVNNTTAAAQKAAKSLPTGLNAIGDFFARLTEGNTWLRLGEGLLGIVLIAVGIARITHAVPIATSIARTAGAAAV